MHAKSIVLSVALMIGLPAVAHAQTTEAERRMFEAQQANRDLELRQRVEQVERTVVNLELRQRTEDNLRDMRAATTVVGPAFPQVETPLPLIPNRSGQAAARARTQEEIQATELAASNARLRAITQAGR